ncbi:MAG TPA: VWA domain-containing protein [bacterium]|nr:VWA domain-containing protein [bacterium]
MPLGFRWPLMLWGLLLLPAFAAGYAWMLRRRIPRSIAFPALWLVAEADRRARRRRALPAGLFIAAVGAAVAALAGPMVPMPRPVIRSAVMLSIDVSGSMLSEDIAPSRLEAARTAAKGFAAGLPRGIPVGLVTFAGDAQLVMPPIDDLGRVLAAIDGITVRHRTAIGEGLIEAVAALPERTRPPSTGPLPTPPAAARPPAVVVLLSDGQNNSGRDPLEAADWARRQQVTVYTVGIGQPLGSTRGFMIGGPLDEATLQAIAERTGGAYHHASSAGELRTIYRTLGRSVGWTVRPVEVTGLAAGLAALGLLFAVWLSVRAQPLLS